MRSILHLITRLDRGGTVGVVLPLAEAALKRGMKVVIVAGDTADGRIIKESYPQLDIRLIPELLRPIKPISDLKALRKICGLLLEENFDIVHTHTSKSGVIGRIASIITRRGIRVHTPHGHVFHGYFPGGVARLIRTIEIQLAKYTHRFIGVSEEEIRETVEYGVGSADDWRLVHNSIDFSTFTILAKDEEQKLLTKYGFSKDDVIVGFLGRFEKVKGIDLLVDAFIAARLHQSNLKLLLCGDGGLMIELKERLEKANLLSHAVMPGWCENIWEQFSIMDCCILPSRMEGLGKTAVEALYAGVPVIAADVGGLKTLFGELSLPGRLLKPECVETLTTCLSNLSKKECNQSAVLPVRDKLHGLFGLNRMIASTFEVYRELWQNRVVK